jgi:hypothetical protein
MSFKWSGLLLAALLAGGMGFYYFGLFLPHSQAVRKESAAADGYFWGDDFYPIWLTAHECLAHSCDPYSAESTRKIQIGLFGRALNAGNPGDPPSDYRAFSYPAFVDVICFPLAWLSFPAARAILAFVLPLLSAASVVLWSKALRWNAAPAILLVFVLLTWLSYPGLEALFAQQFGLISAFLLASSVAALVFNRQGLAGCLLALATIKPQMCALLVLCLAMWAFSNLRQRWRFARGFAATLAALAFSAMLTRPGWIGDWLNVLLHYSDYSRPPLLAGFAGPLFGRILILLAIAAAIAFAWRVRQLPVTSPLFTLAMAILLALTVVTLLPEHAVYDHALLLPGIMIIVRYWRRLWSGGTTLRITMALAAGALAWQWIAAGAVVTAWAIFPGHLAALLFLPIRTAAAVPFVVIGILLLTKRIVQSSIVVMDEPGRVQQQH